MELQSLENSIDKFTWRCKKCKSRKSIRVGTWFERSHLSLSKVSQVTFFWCDRQRHEIVRREVDVSEHTIVDWFNFCRDVCVEIVLNQSDRIGGPGKTVEIDESKFGKRKYHRGRQVDGKWVFGGVERESSRCFLEIVSDRSRDTLIPLIEKYIEPGTTIISDCWSAYDSLGKEGYTHLTVNHSLHFVDPVTQAHTNKVEGLWSCVKRFLPDCNRSKGLFSSYLAEYMYRQLRKTEKCFYSSFLKDITTLHNVDNPTV